MKSAIRFLAFALAGQPAWSQPEHAKESGAGAEPVSAAKPSFDICTEPVKAVCSTLLSAPKNIATEEQIRRKAADGSENGKDPFAKLSKALEGSSDPVQAMGEYRQVLSRVKAAVMDEWAKHNVTEDQISKRVWEVKNALISHHASSPQAQAKLRSVRIVTASSLLQSGTDDELVPYYQHCGIDGLARQAFYDPNTNQLTICLGKILLMAQSGGDFRAFDRVIGHETHHSIDTNEAVLPPARYAAYLRCLSNSEQIQKMAPLSKAIDYRKQRGIPDLKQLLERLKAARPPDKDAILTTTRKISAAENSLSGLKWNLDAMVGKYGRNPTAAEGHVDELFADAGGAIALGSTAAKDRAAGRDPLSFVRASLQEFCTKSDSPMAQKTSEILYGSKVVDDGIHPPTEFRIEKILTNPTLRKALGCKVPPKEAWCAP